MVACTYSCFLCGEHSNHKFRDHTVTSAVSSCCASFFNPSKRMLLKITLAEIRQHHDDHLSCIFFALRNLQRGDPRWPWHRICLESRRHLSFGVSAVVRRQCSQRRSGGRLSEFAALPLPAYAGHFQVQVRPVRVSPHLRRLPRAGLRPYRRCAGERSLLPVSAGTLIKAAICHQRSERGCRSFPFKKAASIQL